METLEALKLKWSQGLTFPALPPAYDQVTLDKVIRRRVHQHLNMSMRYFWASLALQILVYAMLSHVIVKYRNNTDLLALSVGGIVLYIPFTVVLLMKFKAMGQARINGPSPVSMLKYIRGQYQLLQEFYRFKMRYELFLIPTVSILGTWITFSLYVPGGATQHLSGVVMVAVVTLVSCTVAIVAENKKSFIHPLAHLKEMLDELEKEV